MVDEQLKLIIGALLHDTGKVLYRADDHRNHSQSGYDFLKNEAGIADPQILNQVRYHHAANIKYANLQPNDLAYITYIADNISSAADRRKFEEEDATYGFDQKMPLDSIFNILNGKHGHFQYRPSTLDLQEGINYPTEEKVSYVDGFYKRIRQNLKEVLRNLNYQDSYVNSLLEVLEANLSFVPSSTSKGERADISLFDHVKLTAAIASCIYIFLTDNQIENWEEYLYKGAEEFYEKPIFLLFSMDMSGIQAFIYQQYGNNDVLKSLRARSFYLEILMENVIDDLLDQMQLSRANLIYSGGGHAYLLLPNTENAREKTETFEKQINEWIREIFKADLYLACGYTSCSAACLKNRPEGSYSQMFRRVSEILSEKKIHRYSAGELLAMNHSPEDTGGRECRICHRSDHLTSDDLCEICEGLAELSSGILKADFFTVICERKGENGIPVGRDRYLVTDSEASLRKRIRSSPEYIRAYAKNRMYTGESLATKLWVGDYSSGQTLGDLVRGGTGIPRLGVLRADIDNLGQAFVAGFPPNYQTLSRSATFSRKLSIFFKLYINEILQNGNFVLGEGKPQRNASIIYSGGDDIFIVGAWKDILEFAVDLQHSLKAFTQNTLTISAGFGIYYEKYPISYIASHTGDLEEFSKQHPGKNSITLFDGNHTYSWEVFLEKVLGEKFALIYSYFQMEKNRSEEKKEDKRKQRDGSTERGKAFLYHILELFRNREEKINLARLAYTLARLEPDKTADEPARKNYREFSKAIFHWMQNDEDSRQAVTAIYLYVYLIRDREDTDETDK